MVTIGRTRALVANIRDAKEKLRIAKEKEKNRIFEERNRKRYRDLVDLMWRLKCSRSIDVQYYLEMRELLKTVEFENIDLYYEIRNRTVGHVYIEADEATGIVRYSTW